MKQMNRITHALLLSTWLTATILVAAPPVVVAPGSGAVTDAGFINIPKAATATVQPAMSRAGIEAGLKSHDRALYLKEGWMRDPYITLGPDELYYLTGTTINADDPREENDPYNLGDKHDPSLFKDDDGTRWFLWQNTLVAPISKDFTKFTAEPVRIDPSSTRPDPNKPGKTITRIGHEGATMIKVGGKYVHLGTAWSTDKVRKGCYNLYYCVSDKITGPYGPRRFVGRFLGHGTPFQTRDGKWWCTAFFNANVPPLPREGIEKRNLSKDAQTINQIEMWQAESFDPKTITKELDLAQGLGFNLLRVFLHGLVWEADEIGLYDRTDQCLKVTDQWGLVVGFAFFDDCHHPSGKLGPQAVAGAAHQTTDGQVIPKDDRLFGQVAFQ